MKRIDRLRFRLGEQRHRPFPVASASGEHGAAAGQSDRTDRKRGGTFAALEHGRRPRTSGPAG